MDDRTTSPYSIAVVGDFVVSDNYPNTKYLLRMLSEDGRFHIVDILGAKESDQVFYHKNNGALNRITSAFRFGVASTVAAFRLRAQHARPVDVIYVPYPAMPTLFLFSLLPKPRTAKPIIADAFISIYDTLVNDRKRISLSNPLAKLLKWVEKRALMSADINMVDTESNRQFLADLFAINKNHFAVSPLCTNEDLFDQDADDNPPDEAVGIKVCFAGSFVPLQGVDTIVKAAIKLSERTDIQFSLIGDGQTAADIDRLISSARHNISWRREWVSSSELFEALKIADICLGVFGDTEKCTRVWPYKNYIAMMMHKTIISGETSALGNEGLAGDVYCAVAPHDDQALARAIEELVDSKARREALAARGRKYYLDHLSNQKAIDSFYSVVGTLL